MIYLEKSPFEINKVGHIDSRKYSLNMKWIYQVLILLGYNKISLRRKLFSLDEFLMKFKFHNYYRCLSTFTKMYIFNLVKQDHQKLLWWW